jgi:4'-phosphopantetheinyl transferase
LKANPIRPARIVEDGALPVDDVEPLKLLWTPAPNRIRVPDGEIQVFAFALDLPEERLKTFAGLLSLDETERAQRFKRERDRRRFMCGRARLRAILGHCLESEPAHLTFSYSPHGKPSLSSGIGRDRVRFNLTGSHGLGLLALQLDSEIGIDVERIRPFPDALGIAQRFFAREEYRRLLSLPEAAQSEGFFRSWTSKEAIVKSIGLGLSCPLNVFTLPGGASETAVSISVPVEGDIAQERWLLPVSEPSPGYVAALATSGPPCRVRCWTWNNP